MAATSSRIDHCSDEGKWTLFRREPPAALSGYVREMQGYYESGTRPVVRKELPSGIVPLIVVVGPGFSLHDSAQDGRARALDRSFVAGLHETPALVGSEGRSVCLQVDLTPIGARRLLGVDMGELTGRVVDLNAILARAVDELEDQLAAMRSWPERFDRLASFLCRRILGGRREDARAAAAWSTLERSAGQIRIEELARALGCSRKQLNHIFKQEVGLSPKAAARVLRFERAMAWMREGRPGSLTEVALACGYADQSHFNRDFRAFAGESPSALMPRVLEDGTGVLASAR